jgi:uncharacterized membrane protein
MPLYLEPQFLIPLVTGTIFFMGGLISLRFSPKKINGIYGYRTPNSMKNQARWDFAQQFASKEMMKLGAILALSACSVFIYVANTVVGLIIAFSLIMLVVVSLLIRTEGAINKKFGK